MSHHQLMSASVSNVTTDQCAPAGMPWKSPAWERPTLGGDKLPFPRRLASNRPTWVDPQGNKTEFELPVDDPNPLLKLIPVG
jgi:hypothetical protein